MTKLMIAAFAALATFSSCGNNTNTELNNNGIKRLTSINALTRTTNRAIDRATNKHTTLNLSVGANGIITLGTITISDWGEKEEMDENAPQT